MITAHHSSLPLTLHSKSNPQLLRRSVQQRNFITYQPEHPVSKLTISTPALSKHPTPKLFLSKAVLQIALSLHSLCFPHTIFIFTSTPFPHSTPQQIPHLILSNSPLRSPTPSQSPSYPFPLSSPPPVGFVEQRGFNVVGLINEQAMFWARQRFSEDKSLW